MTDAITCDDCGQDVQLVRDENRRLMADCGCDAIYVTVKKVLPEDWR